MKRFAVIGVGGYIAPRHLKAIHETGNTVVATLDPHDSVGILDRYFPDAAFFTEPERFDRHLGVLHRAGEGIDCVAICSPNHLHDAHIRLAFRNGADAVCEKPVVIKPRNIGPLQELEQETGHKVNVVLQVRLHPRIIALHERMQSGEHDVDLVYVTPRGTWYDFTWKADPERSGGVVTNIGIHLFDLLLWTFGPVADVSVSEFSNRHIRGSLTLERARVNWLLSTRAQDLPEGAADRSRQMVIDGEVVDFTTGFEDLHTRVYEEVLAGRGSSLEDAYPAVELTERIRNLTSGGINGRSA